MQKDLDPAEPPQTAVPAYTMFIEQSAHMDWDWLETFCGYYWNYQGTGANGILTDAVTFAQAGNPYTVCEMGFFREFLANNPGQVAAIQALPNFHVISGGITSPDCLVCSGEGFIRNYLVGQAWLSAALGMKAQPHCWIPDDFGQDPELPALLQALGFVSVAFSRLSGTQSSTKSPPDSWANQLYQTGLDFVWTASDGSELVAHWLTNHGYPPGTSGYGIGVNLEDSKEGSAAINGFCEAYQPSGTPPIYAGAVTPAMYIPIDDDFMHPIMDAAASIATWNAASGAQANVVAKLGTFDEFIQTVMQPNNLSKLTQLAYNGTPYWTGYYASRPALKTMHYQVQRTLVGAEIFGTLAVIAGATLPASFWSGVEAAWDQFVPSTHHDYVCGTALDLVYTTEQLPRLTSAVTTAAALQTSALTALAGLENLGGQILVGNSLGFARAGVAEVAGIAAPPGGSFVLAGESYPIQTSSEGNLLFLAMLPSFGYATGTLSTEPPTSGLAPVTIVQDGTSFVLRNQFLTAVIDASTGTLLSLTDANSGNLVVGPVSAGDDLRFYKDTGGLYRFGNEAGGELSRDSTASLAGVADVLESGPIRARLRVTVTVNLQGKPLASPYIREITLLASEACLRMAVTGAAPSCYSVMAAHRLSQTPVTIDHGTAGHWTSAQPSAAFWDAPVFRATHDYLLPRGDASQAGTRPPPLCAIFHGGIPAWAIDSDESLIGCLLRNTPNDDGLGASGSDTGTHTQVYAVSVPTSLGEPESGGPLREARNFNTPLVAVEVPAWQSGLPTDSFSLASLPPGDPAILTVAKPGSYRPGSLILRVYQPTNSPATQPFSANIGLGGPQAASANLLNAAEGAATQGSSVSVSAFGDTLALTMTQALVTIEIPEYGLLAAALGAGRNERQDQPICPRPTGS
jgi:alpha-mannosidase